MTRRRSRGEYIILASKMAKKFINEPSACVEEMVQGIVAAHSDRVVRLEGFHVLLHRQIATVKLSQVVLLSGGGSGHEPAHAGYIGDGMLSGAVLGGVFASPSIASIYAAIRAAAGPSGVLLIVKNYTGDRINFGQAALMARADLGVPVEMVVVADDSALPEGKGITGGRGVAGTVFVHKVAGAAAVAGLPLAEVAAAAREAAEAVRTLGTALTTCTVPGTAPSDRLDAQTMEMGLGIHGEPGMRQMPVAQSGAIAAEMLAVIWSRMGAQKPSKVALMVNNLGGTPTLEMYVMANDAVKFIKETLGVEPVRVLVGPFMTSLEMQGISLSLLNVDDPLLLSRLDAPTTAAAWHAPSTLAPQALPMVTLPPSAQADADGAVPSGAVGGSEEVPSALVRAVCTALDEAEPQLTEWDQVAGDGDCGITFQRGAKEVFAKVEGYPLSSGAATFGAVADSISASMGGTSGALLEIFFRAGKVHLLEKPNDFAGAFVKGSAAIQDIGGASEGMRTMLDALLPASRVLADSGDWKLAVEAAEAGAEATVSMKALAGRSNYISEELLATVPDPGAKAVAIAMRAGFAAI